MLTKKQITNHWKNVEQITAKTSLGDKISKDIKRDFKFLEALLVNLDYWLTNNHLLDCEFMKDSCKIYLRAYAICSKTF